MDLRRAERTKDLVVLDGAVGEGGGQILRSALSLSLVTGRPFRIENIRARRKKPGLLHQHLAAVRAAAAVGKAEMEGVTLGSGALTFRPAAVVAGDYAFDVGTAGSATLVLQTVLPALLTATGPSRLRLEGGTHNPLAPPFEFVERCFLPLLDGMGPRVRASLERTGFFPAGGGAFTVTVEPAARLERLEVLERGDVRSCRATAIVARLPESIAERELDVVARELGWNRKSLRVGSVPDSCGPGNVLLLEIESEALTEVIAAFGERGKRAETVAMETVRQARRYLEAGVPAGLHLADQLLLPLALAGGGAFRTLAPSSHFETNAGVIEKFLAVPIRKIQVAEDIWEIKIG